MVRVFFIGLLVGLTLLIPARDAAAQSNVQVVICHGTQPATLSIVRPKSDSVVSEPELVVSGTVSQSNQLEIYIDGAFNSVESLPAETSTYTTSAQLSAGTHTIKLVAVDACQVENASLELVITYQPISTPSSGSQVPTNVQGLGEVREVTPVTSDPIQSFIIAPALAAGKALDLVPADAGSFKEDPANMVRFSALTTAAALIFLSGYLVNGILAIGFQFHLTGLSTSLIQTRIRRALTGIGVIIIVLVFTL